MSHVVSVLDNLRDAATKLNISEQMDTVQFYGLSEKEIALQIYQHYQDLEDETRPCAEKRKLQQESGSNKICKVEYKADDILSALLRLPNELFDHIVKFLFSEDKKNLRLVCRELYHKTTLLAPMFHDWCFEMTRNTLPDFILKSDKKFRVWIGKDGKDANGYFVNRFGHRISSIQIDSLEIMMNYLEDMKPTEFPHLTTLDIGYVGFQNASLLMLAPQLHDLRLCCIMNFNGFDLSTVDEDSKCFTKLKTLELIDMIPYIDVKKILSKCRSSLEYLALESIQLTSGLEDFQLELSSLECLIITIDTNDSHQSIRNLLSRCSKSLRTLNLSFKIQTDVEMDHQTLLDQTMNITTLDLGPNESSFDKFLNRCPFVQKLSIRGYEKEVNEFVLKDLVFLELDQCEPLCMSSALKHASKYSLRYVSITSGADRLIESDFPVCSLMDSVWVIGCDLKDGNVSEELQAQAIDKVTNLFPKDVEVNKEVVPCEGFAEYRRVYNISE